jgi:hypothetical protein
VPTLRAVAPLGLVEMITCPRCPDEVATPRALEAHLVEDHCLGAAQAQREARMPVTALPLAVPPPPGHTCPTCQTVIPCDEQAIAALQRQANRLNSLAHVWRARLEGKPLGRPRAETFDIDEARKMVANGMSYAAVARALGAKSGKHVNAALNYKPRNGVGSKAGG